MWEGVCACGKVCVRVGRCVCMWEGVHAYSVKVCVRVGRCTCVQCEGVCACGKVCMLV